VPDCERERAERRDAEKQLRKVREQLKRNRKRKRVRNREWRELRYVDLSAGERALDDLLDVDTPGTERIVPRGERERRQAAIDAALAAQSEVSEKRRRGEPAGTKGLVVEVSTTLCRVQVGQQILVCGIRGALTVAETGYTNVVAVGDRVIVTPDRDDGGVVEAVLPRRNALARPDVFHHHLRQVVVANADQLLIVASWREPTLWPELMDRYLIAAERSGIRALICVNKLDLARDPMDCRAQMRPYVELGYPVLFTSATAGLRVEALKDALRGYLTVLTGMSGVGKSSLLNTVQPGLSLRTNQVSDHSHTGRHTTTQVNLLELRIGGHVVDTPGIREFGLHGLTQPDLVRFYPEIASVEGQCRFGDCTHSHEPGCAVKAAVRRGLVSTMRLRNYRAIQTTLPKSLSEAREQAQRRAWR
jgi:ribosome biogenesis GTPase